MTPSLARVFAPDRLLGVDPGLPVSAIGAQVFREERFARISHVNHTRDRRCAQVIDPANGAGQLTWVRFPSPAPPSRQAETPSAKPSQIIVNTSRAGRPSQRLSGSGVAVARLSRATHDHRAIARSWAQGANGFQPASSGTLLLRRSSILLGKAVRPRILRRTIEADHRDLAADR
jgi:hypothetical protein